MAWKQVETEGILPFPVEGARSVLVGDGTSLQANCVTIYMFGGVGRYGYHNEQGHIYELKLQKFTTVQPGSQWTIIETMGASDDNDVPLQRSHHTMTYMPQTREIIVFGGTEQDNDVYHLDLNTFRWQRSVADQVKGWPLERQNHSAVEMNGKLYIYGGKSPLDEELEYSDLWEYDPVQRSWTLLYVHDPHSKRYTPKRRYGHSMVTDPRTGSIYVIGGCSGSDPLKEIWEYNVTKREWNCPSYELPATDNNQTIPSYMIPLVIPARHGSAILIGDVILMIGGETLLDQDDGPSVLNDLLVYNTRTNELKLAGISSYNAEIVDHQLLLVRDQLLAVGGKIRWPMYNHITCLQLYDRETDKRVREESIVSKPVFSTKTSISCTEVFDECVDFLKKHGLACEGIFRVSPSYTDLSAVQMYYEVGLERIVTEKLTEPADSHLVAGVLKKYLSKLPEPLLTAVLSAELLEVFRSGGKSDDKATVTNVRNILKKLPDKNKEILRNLLELLSAVAANSDKNQMTANNVARVFSQVLVKYEHQADMEKEMQQTNHAIALVECLLREKNII